MLQLALDHHRESGGALDTSPSTSSSLMMIRRDSLHTSARKEHKQELLMLVLRRGALGCVTPPQLREEIQGEDDQPFLFHMRRLGSQRLDSIALALKCTCPSGADLISWPSSGNLCVRACFPSHAGLFRSDSFLTSAKHRKAFLRWPRVGPAV